MLARGTSILLPGSVTIADTADICRRAVHQFLQLEAHELDAWTHGLYRDAMRFCPRHESEQNLTECPTVETLTEAQNVVAKAIHSTADGAFGIVRWLPPIVRVVAARDRFGGCGFVPFEVSHTSLSDRALALVVADYLTRPDDFITQDWPDSRAWLRKHSETIRVASDDTSYSKTNQK